MSPPIHLWDLQDEADLKSMLETLYKAGHRLSAFQVGSSIQCGWRHSRYPCARDVWGMPLRSRLEALQDATSRFFQCIQRGRDAIYSYPPPSSSQSKPLAPFPPTLR